uniref:Neurotransmitter-gated ion-channel ligand-binding domain-containing protein n=1 Tax=Strigamia maritima TaxID=126957 RepID=T1J026_STRMM
MLLVLFLSLYCVVNHANGYSDKEIADLFPQNYTTIRPRQAPPVDFKWKILTHLISDISLQKMEFSVDLTIDAVWMDDQLNGNSPNLVNLPKDLARKVWHPWITFQNCKNCENIIIDPNENTFYLYERQIGIETRETFVFTCIFDFTYYPFDKQQCNINVRVSFWNGLINVDIDKSGFFSDLLVPPEYSLVSSDQSQKPCLGKDEDSAQYFCFSYSFVFKRIQIHHILLVFLPSMLVVILSWISFWLDVTLAAPRIALGLTSLLTLATQFNAAQNHLPAVATIKAVDVWMFMCIFMVFSSLIVYAISYASNQLKTRQNTLPVADNVPENQSKCAKCLSSITDVKNRCLKRINFADINYDEKARKVFPLLFIIFNIIFWLIYM